MKNHKRTNAIDLLMNEYIEWGGPVVTRAEARRDAILRGLTDREIDIAVIARRAVAAPVDPEAHVAFLVRIREFEGIVA